MTGSRGRVAAGTRPRRLRPGDRVAIVAPSGPPEREPLEAGAAVLRGWGLDVVYGRHLWDVHPTLDYLAGTDADRARDFQEAWCDPSVAAVFCARGGYGAQRMAALVDWERLRAAGPRVFLGYSDITVLHEAVAGRLGLATLHGPMPGTAAFAADSAALEHLRRTLFEPDSVTAVTAPGAAALLPGRAEGVTLGGCSSLLSEDLGSATARPSAAGGILLLENVGEPAYRLDRNLTQLANAGWLDGVAGVALGSWRDCAPLEEIRAVVLDRFGALGVPVVEELGFGHGANPPTVALGVPVTLDADRAVLAYREPPLS